MTFVHTMMYVSPALFMILVAVSIMHMRLDIIIDVALLCLRIDLGSVDVLETRFVSSINVEIVYRLVGTVSCAWTFLVLTVVWPHSRD